MSILSNEKNAGHLMHLIVTRNGNVPNFSLLLGSGASSTSGVKTAQTMIGEWRRLLFDRSGNGGSYPDWLATQSWFEHEDEYSILFEAIFDQPAQRRAQPGPLDSPHRPGSADRDHQDPQTTGLCLGRTDHPLGTPIDPASSPALALGGAVQPRPGPIARPATPCLTAAAATGRHPANRTSPRTRASPVRERLLPCTIPPSRSPQPL